MKSKERLMGAPGNQKPKKYFWMIFLFILISGGVLFFIISKNQPILDHQTIESQGIEKALRVLTFRPEDLPKAIDEKSMKKALLGQLIFHDLRLSKDGAFSCESCHKADQAFTDGRPFGIAHGVTKRNVPTLINLFRSYWFDWDGRADSIASQAIIPFEHPDEMAISRTRIARLIREHYPDKYMEAFGPLPTFLDADLLEEASPTPKPAAVSVDISSYALSTMGNYEILERLLVTSNRNRSAPTTELSQISSQFPMPPVEWGQRWDTLDPTTQDQINQVIANIGLAIEAYLNGIIAVDAPFDRYAERVLHQEQDIREALNEEFGDIELAGFQLFIGKGKCTLCHSGPTFTNQQFHNIGLAAPDDGTFDLGRAQGVLQALQSPFHCMGPYLPSQSVENPKESCLELPYLDTENLEWVGAFKTPTLRNLGMTAPYSHDGRFATLSEMLEHYNFLDVRPAIGHREETLEPLDLSHDELASLEAFLMSLNSPVIDLTEEFRQKKKGVPTETLHR